MLPLIFDVKKFEVHDGPGIRTTYFLKGCPLRCKWCQNPESFSPAQEIRFRPLKCIGCGLCRQACPHIGEDLLVDPADCTLCGDCVRACKAGARVFIGKTLSPQELAEQALREKSFFDASGGGITFSGGECMLYPDYIAACAALLREKGIGVAVDTCGHVPPESFRQVAPLAELFLYDLKKLDGEAHRALTGSDNARILGNLRYLCSVGARVILRVPLIPGLTDSRSDMAAIAGFVAGELRGRIERVELLPYNKLAAVKYGNGTILRGGGPGPYPLGTLEPQTKEYVSSLARIFEEKQIPVFAEVL